MEVIKKINNNVALARDNKGWEMVVFGKGIGFPAMPYQLSDLSGVQRTFYDVNPEYFPLLSEIPEEIILAADDIAEAARDELDCRLNPNLTFVLADHINFAIQRSRNGLKVETPLAYDVRHLYPAEYELGRRALKDLNRLPGVELPDSEAVSIALHLINAEAQNGDLHSTMTATRIIAELTDLVEDHFQISLDRDGFHYSRFVMHLRYLVQRMMQGKPVETDDETAALFYTMRREHPDTYECMCKVVDYFKQTWNWECTASEQLYLMLHIHRVRADRRQETEGGTEGREP